MQNDFSRPFQQVFNQNQKSRKNTFDVNNGLASPTIKKQEQKKKIQGSSSQSLVFRFLRILQKRTQQLKEDGKILSFLQNIYQEKIKNTEQNEQKQTGGKYVINPNNFIALVFQFLKCSFIFLLLVIITYIWSFENMMLLVENNSYLYIISILIMDISFQINLAIIIRGQIIYDRVEILKEYISRHFFEDTIFFISLVLIIYTSQIIFVIVFYINGIGMLLKIIRKFEELFDLSVKKMELLKLCKLLFFINLLAHFIACIWHYIGMHTINTNNNWLDSKNIRDESNFIKYIYSFYWSVATMVTVGYGDITPQNYLEIILCIFIMFLSCGLYAYSLNTIGQIISILNHESDKLEKNFRILNNYFKQHNIKEKLQSRIKNYLEYKFKEEEKQNQNVYTSMLSKCPLLKSIPLLETLNYEPDDLIVMQNIQNENAFYFIDQGTVELFEQRTKTLLTEFSSGDSFGQYEFFTNSQALFTYKCRTHTRIFKLSRSKFLEILNKEDFEIFHKIKHCFEFNIPMKHFQCIMCQKNDHLMHQCKLLFYIPDISKMVIRLQNIKQKREFKQRRIKRQNSIFLLPQVQQKQFEYHQQYIQEYSQKEIIDEDNIIMGPDSLVNSLMYNILKPSEIQIQVSNQMDLGKEILNVNSIKKINTQNVKNKQSLLETGNNQEPLNKIKRPSLKKQDAFYNQTLIFDRMKDFNQYFCQYNSDLQIRKYNQNYIQKGHLALIRKRPAKAMRFIQI